jgi:hypothetical protein
MKGEFWTMLKEGAEMTAELKDARAHRFEVAHFIWTEIGERIDEKDELDAPRCFHIDQKLDDDLEAEALINRRSWDRPKPPEERSFPRFARFLASLAVVDRLRPGRDPAAEDVTGEKEIAYSINFDRWVLCSTYMATHTRLTTMDAANESARHAVKAILSKMSPKNEGRVETKPIDLGGHTGAIKSLAKTTYNGTRRAYDQPDIFNPEDFEFEDLDIFRRIDRRLLKLDLKHFLDIIQFDEKLEHALEGAALYGDAKSLPDVVKILEAGLDAAFVTQFGRERRDQVDQTVRGLAGFVPPDLVDGLDRLLTQLKSLSRA